MSSKGQIVIPIEMRRRLGLKAGHAQAVRAGTDRELVYKPVEDASGDL